jgi:hypothetical protein
MPPLAPRHPAFALGVGFRTVPDTSWVLRLRGVSVFQAVPDTSWVTGHVLGSRHDLGPISLNALGKIGSPNDACGRQILQ